MKFRSLAVLAALGLAAAHPAQAQTLTLTNGDNVLVSGGGTTGTVNSATSSYIDPGVIPYYAVMVGGSATFTLGAGGAVTATGHGDPALEATGSGPLAVRGGTITGSANGPTLFDTGSSTLTVSGGTILGGASGSALAAYGSGPVTISGGAITAGQSGYGLDAQGTGPVTVIGGTFTTGPSGLYGLYAQGSGTINLFSLGGSTFFINGVAMNNKALAFGSSGTISGTLLDGETLNTTFRTFSTINLNVGTPPVLAAAVPEPSSVAAFAFTSLFAAGLMLRARRSRHPA